MSVTSSAAKQPLVEVDSLEIHVLVNDEIDQISPSPNPRVQHKQSFAGVPLSRVPDPTARGGANWEMPMRNICCGAHGLSLFIVSIVVFSPNLWRLISPLDGNERRPKPHAAL